MADAPEKENGESGPSLWQRLKATFERLDSLMPFSGAGPMAIPIALAGEVQKTLPNSEGQPGISPLHRAAMLSEGGLNGVTGLLSAPGYLVDGMNMALMPLGFGVERPVGGSQWITENLNAGRAAYYDFFGTSAPQPIDVTDHVLLKVGEYGTITALPLTYVKSLQMGSNIIKVTSASNLAPTATSTTGAGLSATAAPAAAPTAASFAGSVANAAWWTTKAAAKTTVFPIFHPVATLLGVGVAYQLTDGKSTPWLIDRTVDAWNFVGEQSPSFRNTAEETVLGAGSYVSEGIAGSLLTVAERGGGALVEEITSIPGIPLSIRAAAADIREKGRKLKGEITGHSNSEGESPNAAAENAPDGEQKPGIQKVIEHVEDLAGTGVGPIGIAFDAVGGKEMAGLLEGKTPQAKKFIQENKEAVALGALLGANANGGLVKKGMMAAIWTAVLAPIMNFLKPILTPLLSTLKGHAGQFYGQYTPDGGEAKPEPAKTPFKFTRTEQHPTQHQAETDGPQLYEVHPEKPLTTTPLAANFDKGAKDPVTELAAARVEEHITTLRKENPGVIYLASKKNEDQYRALMTEKFTAQIRDEKSQAQALSAQNNSSPKVYFQPRNNSTFAQQPLMLSMN